jgi:hypothetical protein
VSIKPVLAASILLFLTPLCTGSGEASLNQADAKAFAEDFADAWIEEGWEGVKQYVADEGPSRELIERGHDFFVAQEFSVVGPARYVEQVSFIDVPGYAIPIVGRRGDLSGPVDPTLREWTMELVLVEEDGSWRVAQYGYESGEPLG